EDVRHAARQDEVDPVQAAQPEAARNAGDRVRQDASSLACQQATGRSRDVSAIAEPLAAQGPEAHELARHAQERGTPSVGHEGGRARAAAQEDLPVEAARAQLARQRPPDARTSPRPDRLPQAGEARGGDGPAAAREGRGVGNPGAPQEREEARRIAHGGNHGRPVAEERTAALQPPQQGGAALDAARVDEPAPVEMKRRARQGLDAARQAAVAPQRQRAHPPGRGEGDEIRVAEVVEGEETVREAPRGAAARHRRRRQRPDADAEEEERPAYFGPRRSIARRRAASRSTTGGGSAARRSLSSVDSTLNFVSPTVIAPIASTRGATSVPSSCGRTPSRPCGGTAFTSARTLGPRRVSTVLFERSCTPAAPVARTTSDCAASAARSASAGASRGSTEASNSAAISRAASAAEARSRDVR